MNNNEKLKEVCFYKECDLLNTNTIYYLEPQIKDISKIKQKNRDLAIGAIVDDEIDEYKSGYVEIKEDDFGTIEMVINSKSLTIKDIAQYDQIYYEVFNFLNTNIQIESSLNYTIEFDENKTRAENYEYNVRRFMSKIMMASNMIAVKSRIGSANFVLVGRDCQEYVDTNNNYGIKVIFDDTIDSDKIIVGNSGKENETGLTLLIDKINNKYAFEQVGGWENKYCCFKIIR